MEHIRLPKVEQVKLLDRVSPRKSRVGTLYLTATHTIFVESEDGQRDETWVLHSLVSSLEKSSSSSSSSSGVSLMIHCKNFQLLQFVIPEEQDCQDILLSLQRLSQPESYEELYCFAYKPNVAEEERQREWDFIDLTSEYKRMGVPNSHWKLSQANQDYKVSDTYPSEVFVPESATLPVIVGSSKFRAEDDFPPCATTTEETTQPCVAVVSLCPASALGAWRMSRFERNRQQSAGKGYENEDNYSNIKFQFLGIENIHVMRNSQQKMLEVCELRSPSMSDFLERLENSSWLKHIKAVLDAALFVAKAVSEEGVSVLVHCSDGWDRTSQVCSVASLLLEPHYRTLRGFMVLIEKDWISFGHKFSHRCNHLDGDPKEVSPIVDQFLECVWQVTEQFPCAFEFNERFLITVHHHIYSCQFGNFIGNNQKEREQLEIQKRTHSLWTYLWSNRADFINPLYRSNHSQTQGVLQPSTAPYCFKFWKGLYNRFERGVHPRQSVEDCLRTIREETEQLEEQLASHKQKISKLEEQKWTVSMNIFDKSPTAWIFSPT
ncbi:hypothetical protein WMY93_020343 [Mugilogobius chulae]|uniref:Phosphatidylinositol-3-phosphate phosphatase n=1 Tax=Mugilogobius chulae TaxID=88201 RepID=A0AAW0NGU1_9GOBI